ncbi:MAG: GAF domain-containing sensor histidine kinase [Anaerolineales bacterium]|nr:MAG: GAF domain-containing sensor histidine kinase [Anaerolineales bacterium]
MQREEWTLEEKVEVLERRVAVLERILRISQILTSTLQLEPLLQTIAQSATELTDTAASSIMLVDKNTGELHFETVSGSKREEVKRVTVPLDGSIAGWIVREGKPLLIPDVRQDPRFYAQVDETTDFETRSILGVPLQVRGKVIGVLEALNKMGDGIFTQDDIHTLSTLAAHAAIAIENARLVTEIQKAYEELSELDRLKSEFVAIASHELQTPLTVILGYASFLKKETTGAASEQVDAVLQSALRLRSLINDMINLRHIETGEAELELEQLSLNELSTTITAEFASLAEAKKQSVTIQLASQPPMVEADRQKLHLVLANLLSNAIKFTPEGGRIQVEVETKGNEVRVSVRDTGIGIPPREQERIFDRFYQVEPSLTRRFEGMGLGLSIAKGMIELHGGRIWVESLEGMGSSFTFALPLVE